MSHRPVYKHIRCTARNLGFVRYSSFKRPPVNITLDHGQKLTTATTKSNKATYEAYIRRSEKYNPHGDRSRREGNFHPGKDGEATSFNYTPSPRDKSALAAVAQDRVSAPKISRLIQSIVPTEIVQEPKGYHDTQTFSYRWHTPAPERDKLDHAGRFFLGSPCKLLYTVSKLHEMKKGTIPEVAFLGRSNVGKSSLLNALMGQELCFKSKKPGRTKTMNAFGVGGPSANSTEGKIAVLDMPGYGYGSRDAWGPEIMKYLVGRDQLKRAFLLVDALHGLKPSDIKVLEFLRLNQVSHQVILSKVDRILVPGAPSALAKLDQYYATLRKIMENMRQHVQPGIGDGPEAVGEILCSSKQTLTVQQTAGWEFKVRKNDQIGVAGVRWAVLVATGFERQSKMDAIMVENKRKKQSFDLNVKIEKRNKVGIKRTPRTTAQHRADPRPPAQKAYERSKGKTSRNGRKRNGYKRDGRGRDGRERDGRERDGRERDGRERDPREIRGRERDRNAFLRIKRSEKRKRLEQRFSRLGSSESRKRSKL